MKTKVKFVGVCEGWAIPMHSTNQSTAVVRTDNGKRLTLCSDCFADFFDDKKAIEVLPFTAENGDC